MPSWFLVPTAGLKLPTLVMVNVIKGGWVHSPHSPAQTSFTSGGQISTKHQKTSIKPFFATCRLPQYPEFAKNLRSFDGFYQMSGLWSMFWFKSFQKFFQKIMIFCTFDHRSEILSLSAGRPISQDACPALALSPPSLLTVGNEEII